MASAEAKVTIYTCDAPECDETVIAQNGDLPAGFLGTIKWSNASGDFEAYWFAHTANHIRKAVTGVMETSPDHTALADPGTPVPAVSKN